MSAQQQSNDLNGLRESLRNAVLPGSSFTTLGKELYVLDPEPGDDDYASACSCHRSVTKSLRRIFPAASVKKLSSEPTCSLDKGRLTNGKTVTTAIKEWSNGRTDTRGARLSYERVSRIARQHARLAAKQPSRQRALIKLTADALGLSAEAQQHVGSEIEVSILVSAYIVSTTLNYAAPIEAIEAELSDARAQGKCATGEDIQYIGLLLEHTRFLITDRSIYGLFDIPLDAVYMCCGFNRKPDCLVEGKPPGKNILITGDGFYGKSATIQAFVRSSAKSAINSIDSDEPPGGIPFLIVINRHNSRAVLAQSESVRGTALLKMLAIEYPAGNKAPEDAAAAAIDRLGEHAVIFVDGIQDAADQELALAACDELFERFPEARYVISSQPLPASSIGQSPLLESCALRKLNPFGEKETLRLLGQYCTVFASGDERAAERAFETISSNHFMMRISSVPGRAMYCARSVVSNGDATPFGIIGWMLNRKIEAVRLAPTGGTGAPLAMNASTLTTVLGVIALNSILGPHAPDTLRVDYLKGGYPTEERFAEALATAYPVAVGGTPNKQYPSGFWQELARTLTYRSGIFAHDGSGIKFADAYAAAYLAANYIVAAEGMTTPGSEAAFRALTEMISDGQLESCNSLADLISMTFVAIREFSNKQLHDKLLKEVLSRVQAENLSNEESVRLAHILEVATDFSLGETYCYPMEYVDDTGKTSSNMEEIDRAKERLSRIITTTREQLLRRHKKRRLQPRDATTTIERLEYLGDKPLYKE